MTTTSTANVGTDTARTVPPVERISHAARIDAARTAAVTYGATLNDIADLLGLLGEASLADLAGPTDRDKDFQRAVALGQMQGIASCLAVSLRRFDQDARAAQPEELAEVVRDARQSCAAAHLGCAEYVLPWTYDGTFCSPKCRSDHMRSQGETWPD